MRGYVISVVSLSALVLFCLSLFATGNISMLWLFLELSTLSLVPVFFFSGDGGCLEGLFSYLVVSAISSSFIVCGLLFEGMMGFLLLGLLIKFGLFPFFGWVYKVVSNSNWGVIWGFSTFLKSPVFLICFFLSGGVVSIVSVISLMSFLVLSLLFWCYSYSWFHCWCHMMVSSSVALVAMSSVSSVDSLLLLFAVYVLWASCVIMFLSSLSQGFVDGLLGVLLFCGILLSFPVSLSVFYKLLMAVCIYSCTFPVFLGWVVYSISEQLYLLKFLVDVKVPRWEMSSVSIV